MREESIGSSLFIYFFEAKDKDKEYREHTGLFGGTYRTYGDGKEYRVEEREASVPWRDDETILHDTSTYEKVIETHSSGFLSSEPPDSHHNRGYEKGSIFQEQKGYDSRYTGGSSTQSSNSSFRDNTKSTSSSKTGPDDFEEIYLHAFVGALLGLAFVFVVPIALTVVGIYKMIKAVNNSSNRSFLSRYKEPILCIVGLIIWGLSVYGVSLLAPILDEIPPLTLWETVLYVSVSFTGSFAGIGGIAVVVKNMLIESKGLRCLCMGILMFFLGTTILSLAVLNCNLKDRTPKTPLIIYVLSNLFLISLIAKITYLGIIQVIPPIFSFIVMGLWGVICIIFCVTSLLQD